LLGPGFFVEASSNFCCLLDSLLVLRSFMHRMRSAPWMRTNTSEALATYTLLP
jgi:hypothetical protein